MPPASCPARLTCVRAGAHHGRTLDHVESISSDVSVLARDSGMQRNLKTLVQALSRLLDE